MAAWNMNISASKMNRMMGRMTVSVKIPPAVLARTLMRIKAMGVLLRIGLWIIRLGCAIGGVEFQGREAGGSSEGDPPAHADSRPAPGGVPRRWGRIGTPGG